jgi:alkaline phosphatase D
VDEPIHSERRKLGRGIYTTYTFGDPQTHKTVRVILLDVRFYKQNLFHDIDADILDEEQWQWLEKILSENNETFTFLATGTQVLPTTRYLSECWFSHARKRLFNLLGKLKKPGVVLLSGDIHLAQFLKTFCVLPGKYYKLILRNRVSYT